MICETLFTACRYFHLLSGYFSAPVAAISQMPNGSGSSECTVLSCFVWVELIYLSGNWDASAHWNTYDKFSS